MEEDYISGICLYLGTKVGDRYITNYNTANILNDINSRLNEEDKTLQTYRKQLNFAHLVKGDLIPILLNGSADIKVYDATVRLLVNLLVPVECLVPPDHVKSRKSSIHQLSMALGKTKELFRHEGPTESVLQFLSSFSAGSSKQKQLSVREVSTINNSLLLLRNVLHIPDNTKKHREPNCSTHNKIIWNLFKQNIDVVISELMGHVNASDWASAIVQLVALLYKDQHVLTLQTKLNAYMETTIGDVSEEDYESNTSPNQERENESPSTIPSTDRTNEDSNSSDPEREYRGPNGARAENSPSKVKKVAGWKSAREFSSGVGSSHHSSNTSKQSRSTTDNNEADGEPPLKKLKTEKEPAFKSTTDSALKNHIPRNDNDNKPKVENANLIMSGDRIMSGDSSDNSDIFGVPKLKKVAGDYVTDFGYVTQLYENKNQEQSSSDDNLPRDPRPQPVKLKPNQEQQTPIQKRKQRLMWLFNVGREKRMRLKAMVNHLPTNEDITELLVDFTIEFLFTAFGKLVDALMGKEGSIQNDLEKSHFLWLVSYFLKISYLIDMELDQISLALSFKAIALITYEGLVQLETLELANRDMLTDINPHSGRMHLVVTAIKEFLQAIATYKQSHYLTQGEKYKLDTLQHQISASGSLRQLLLLLLRSYNPLIQSLQYLGDLVMCNHMVLVNLEEVDGTLHESLKLGAHLKQFANTELMRQYGRLLAEYYRTPVNGDGLVSLNDGIFTMMHHVAGDLNAPHTLYLPTILQTFSRILEDSTELCDDWVDLVEYIIQKFIQTMGRSPQRCAETMADGMDIVDIVDSKNGLTPSQTNQMFYHFSKVENTNDPVGALIEIYRQTDGLSLSRLAVIQSLLTHGIITHAQYMNFMYMKSVMEMHTIEKEPSVLAEVGSEHCASDGHLTDNEDIEESSRRQTIDIREIEVLKDCLKKQGRESLITWVQDVLVDVCRVKISPNGVFGDGDPTCRTPNEPIPFHFNLAKQNIPLVPFNRVQYQGLQTEAFVLLLHKLGFLLPADVGKVYPRIPYFWSADHLLTVANKLGPLKTHKLSKKDMKRINETNANTETNLKNETTNDGSSSGYRSTSEWFRMSMASKTLLLPPTPMNQT